MFRQAFLALLALALACPAALATPQEGESASEAAPGPPSGGAGPMIMFLFNKVKSKYGDFTGWSTYVGGRGYGYVLDGRLRIGGAGAGGGGSNEGVFLTGIEGYPQSLERGQDLVYGGVTLEYALRFGRYIEVPLGLLVGYGTGGYSADISRDPSHEVVERHEAKDQFVAIQFMAGFEFNVLRWMRLFLTGTYLMADPFGATDNVGGVGLFTGIAFGEFWGD